MVMHSVLAKRKRATAASLLFKLSNLYEKTLFVSCRILASKLRCNVIDNPLLLTLIKIEHIQEIKLSLSHCNEMVSIT